ncbi:ComF family protein [Flavobacterium sp.]|uniref:ComF family protein n=1 Tax=Flavobacterium sp. TaxID=239 RepID=UPI003B9AA409
MLSDLLNVLYPPVCCGCRNLLGTGERVICTQCRHELALTNYHLYRETEAASKFSGRLELAFVSCFVYFSKSNIAQKLIHELKYKGQQQIGELFAYWYAADLKQVPALEQVDYVIPVPLHRRRLRERGYNQVDRFAQTLADAFGAKYNDRLLIRNSYRKTLTTKNKSERLAQAGGIFGLNPFSDTPPGHYLLVDDVLTTGSTLTQCGQVLSRIPGVKLSIVTMAMSV